MVLLRRRVFIADKRSRFWGDTFGTLREKTFAQGATRETPTSRTTENAARRGGTTSRRVAENDTSSNAENYLSPRISSRETRQNVIHRLSCLEIEAAGGFGGVYLAARS